MPIWWRMLPQKAFGATFDVDDSLVNEDESELPPELLAAPAVAD